MVFCGKPSLACGECRLRRTKCDNKRPSCSQCIRAGRTCKGYRDLTDLMFRDESKTLSNKRKKRQDAQIQGSSVESTSFAVIESHASIGPSTTLTQRPLTPTFSRPLGPSVENQAICFFFHNYVQPQERNIQGGYQYLYDVYNNEIVDGALTDSIAALGMVGLANSWKSSKIMFNSNIKYNHALRTISSKLRDLQEAKADQTLIAITLLGLYEMNTCNDRQSMGTWTKHINGAVTLLKMRGKSQLKTPLGRKLFVHVRTQVILNCIQRHATVPSIIGEWSDELDFETPYQAAATALAKLATRYCNLRASMSSFQDYSKTAIDISTTRALEANYDNWVKNCPPDFSYQTVALKERSEEVFSDHYHVYTNIWIATMWNHCRCTRILTNELLLDRLEYLSRNDLNYEPTSSSSWLNQVQIQNQIMETKSTLLQLAHEICSSVPYFLDFNPGVPPSLRILPKAVNGNILIWPLYAAGVTNIVSDMMRTWAAGRLQWIANYMGIRQAVPLALALSKKQDILEWQLDKAALATISSGFHAPGQIESM